MIQEEIIDVIYNLLAQGHYICITTNGTLAKRIDEILTFPKKFLKRLLFNFSFHYLELVRMNLLEVFFDNIKRVRRAGCSITVKLTLCDEYLLHLDDIKKISLKELGVLPQIGAAYDFANYTPNGRPKFLTSLSDDEYLNIGKSFNSAHFDFQIDRYKSKIKGFCYAGDWLSCVNLTSGDMRSCIPYDMGIHQNIFEDLERPIVFEAIGHNCTVKHCLCAPVFLPFGIMPSLSEIPTYVEIRDRPEAKWFTRKTKSFYTAKLYEVNERYDKNARAGAEVGMFHGIIKKFTGTYR